MLRQEEDLPPEVYTPWVPSKPPISGVSPEQLSDWPRAHSHSEQLKATTGRTRESIKSPASRCPSTMWGQQRGEHQQGRCAKCWCRAGPQHLDPGRSGSGA